MVAFSRCTCNWGAHRWCRVPCCIPSGAPPCGSRVALPHDRCHLPCHDRSSSVAAPRWGSPSRPRRATAGCSMFTAAPSPTRKACGGAFGPTPSARTGPPLTRACVRGAQGRFPPLCGWDLDATPALCQSGPGEQTLTPALTVAAAYAGPCCRQGAMCGESSPWGGRMRGGFPDAWVGASVHERIGGSVGLQFNHQFKSRSLR